MMMINRWMIDDGFQITTWIDDDECVDDYMDG